MYLSCKNAACITSKCAPLHFFLIALSEDIYSRNKVLLLCVSNIFNKVIKVFHLDYAEEASDVV